MIQTLNCTGIKIKKSFRVSLMVYQSNPSNFGHNEQSKCLKKIPKRKFSSWKYKCKSRKQPSRKLTAPSTPKRGGCSRVLIFIENLQSLYSPLLYPSEGSLAPTCLLFKLQWKITFNSYRLILHGWRLFTTKSTFTCLKVYTQPTIYIVDLSSQ